MLSNNTSTEQFFYGIILVPQHALQYLHCMLSNKRRWFGMWHGKFTVSDSWSCKKIREKGNYFQKLLPVFILKCLRQFKGKYFIFMAVLSESLRQKCYILELQTKKIPVQNNVPISWFKVVHPNAELLNICSTLRKSSPCSQWYVYLGAPSHPVSQIYHSASWTTKPSPHNGTRCRNPQIPITPSTTGEGTNLRTQWHVMLTHCWSSALDDGSAISS